MKKVLSIIAALTAALNITIGAMAASSSISIKNNDPDTDDVQCTYDADKGATQKINSLMTKLPDLEKRDSVVQTLTVSSETEKGKKTAISLKISLHEDESQALPEQIKTPSDDEYSALYYYNLKITDKDGNVLYSYEDDNAADKAKYREISLAVMNGENTSESKVFNLTISVNDELKTDNIKSYAENLDWEITASPYTEADTADTAEETLPVVSSTEEEQTEQTAAPQEETDVLTLKSGEYLCGTDVEPGRYTMSGEGKVHVYTDEGILKMTIALKKAGDNSASGVEEYIINLEDGEKIVVDSQIKLVPYTAAASPKATAEAKEESSASDKKDNNDSKSGSSASGNSSETNPKTGDAAPIVAVSAVGVIAAGMIVLLEIKKRKSK